MSSLRRLCLLLPLVSMPTLTSVACQSIVGIHDVGLDEDGATSGLPRGTGGDSPAGSTSSGVGGGGAGGDTGVPDFSFAVLTPNVTVPLGGKNVIEVEIRRTGGFSGEVTVAPVSPPAGLVVEPVTLAEGQTNAEVAVGADAPLALGNTISFTLSASSGELSPKTAEVAGALITGRPGAPDDTFGAAATGIAAISFGSDDGGGFSDLEVISGKIVVAGTGYGGLGGAAFAVTRFTGAGGVDPDFAGGTLVKTRFGGSSGSTATAAAVGHQVNGKIIVMGHDWESAGQDIAVQRLSVSGGTGDPLFGNNGKSLINVGGTEEVFDGIVLSNDRILTAGAREGQLMLARVTSDGTLDTAFASPNGYLTWALERPSAALAVAVDAQNRILVAGQAGTDGQHDVALGRYLQDGQPDTTFGQGGVQIFDGPGTDERAVAIAVLTDGRILVGGDSNLNGKTDFQVRRLLADGSPDTSFGAGGVATLPITDGNDVAEDMVVLPDGRIVVVGNANGGSSPGPILARYKRDGRIDPNFGTGGVATLYVGDSGVINCIANYPDHKVVVCGGNAGGVPGPGTFGIVARLWM